jgi:uncharacterized membrane protein YhaH (DUF805 family)
MSVLEFISTYYDWYLLIGGIVFVVTFVNDIDDHDIVGNFIGSIVVGLIWPVTIVFRLMLIK